MAVDRSNQLDYLGSLLQERQEALNADRPTDRLSIAIDHLAEGIMITDAEGRIEYTNPAFTKITGYRREEVLGQNPRILKSGQHPDSFYEEMWNTVLRGETWTGRFQNRRKDGVIILEEARISPVRNHAGEITHYVAVKRDVTSEVAMEKKLRESQKLEAIGTLAGGIAHDFNNILYALLGYAQLAEDELEPGTDAHQYLHEIIKAGERASSLVAKMLAFGQRAATSQSEVCLKDVVLETLGLMRASLPATIAIETDLPEDCSFVLADPTQMQQVILNLCTNAGYAMRDTGGTLRVEIDAIVDRFGADRPPNPAPGFWARLRVSDTGAGIDPAMAERIFEPYFTTKKSNEGTGLGLAIVHGIVKNHGGEISVESEVDRGTTFTILLPSAVAAGKTRGMEPDRQDVRGNARVLVVDDEEMIVDVAVRGLTRLGFEVVGMTDGVEAVEVFRRDPMGFDAVVTDQTMPGITGLELAAQMLAIRPDLPLILTTGYCCGDGEAKMREVGIRRLLTKPLRIRDLGEALEELTCAPAVN